MNAPQLQTGTTSIEQPRPLDRAAVIFYKVLAQAETLRQSGKLNTYRACWKIKGRPDTESHSIHHLYRVSGRVWHEHSELLFDEQTRTQIELFRAGQFSDFHIDFETDDGIKVGAWTLNMDWLEL